MMLTGQISISPCWKSLYSYSLWTFSKPQIPNTHIYAYSTLQRPHPKNWRDVGPCWTTPHRPMSKLIWRSHSLMHPVNRKHNDNSATIYCKHTNIAFYWRSKPLMIRNCKVFKEHAQLLENTRCGFSNGVTLITVILAVNWAAIVSFSIAWSCHKINCSCKFAVSLVALSSITKS